MSLNIAGSIEAMEKAIESEWLTTSPCGAYAMGTVAGLNTRKYHGLLVVPMNPPVKRVMLLGRVEDFVEVGGRITGLHASEYPGEVSPTGYQHLQAFSSDPYPRWAYRVGNVIIEKSLRLCPWAGSVVLSYTVLGGNDAVSLEVRPILPLRPIHELQRCFEGKLTPVQPDESTFRIPATQRTPEVFFAHDGAFRPSGYWYDKQMYRREADRGYACIEDAWSPGVIRFNLRPGVPVHLVCSAEPVSVDAAISALDVEDAHAAARRAIQHDNCTHLSGHGTAMIDPTLQGLLRAAELACPSIKSSGTGPRVWSGTTSWPWGDVDLRQHLMAFEGLYCCTGHTRQGWVFLRSLIEHLKSGHLPDRIDERTGKPAYDGSDTALWAIHAMNALLSHEATVGRGGAGSNAADEDTLQFCMLVADNICHAISAGHHPLLSMDDDRLVTVRPGTRPGTWMNAYGAPTYDGDLGWQVTPRVGKAVEVNALWYSALRITADLCMHCGREADAARWGTVALAAKQSFNRLFWDSQTGYCYDVLTAIGPDDHCRPSALWSIALPYAVLETHRWHTLLSTVERELLTPAGLRTLAPGDPAYRGRCQGHATSRDAAIHQGSVHPFLLGLYCRAFLRVAGATPPNRARVRGLVNDALKYADNWRHHLVPELLDGDAPHAGGAGAVTSALSVGELLRCYAQDAGAAGPGWLAAESQADTADRFAEDVDEARASQHDA